VSEPSKPTGAPEIELTPAVIDAGVGAYCARDTRVQSDEEIIAMIWEAMRLVALKEAK
jgi:hypothetical protein